MLTIVLVLMAYLIGSVSFALLVSKIFQIPDPRTFGSKNPGATNMLRSGKKIAAAVTLLGDGAKGWFAVYLAQHFADPQFFVDWVIGATGCAVILGHMFPVFFRFSGGKGVATAAGVLFGFNLLLGGFATLLWVIVFAITRISSLSALIATAAAPLAAIIIFEFNVVYPFAALIVAMLIFLRHKTNIHNLLSGKEGKIAKAKKPDS